MPHRPAEADPIYIGFLVSARMHGGLQWFAINDAGEFGSPVRRDGGGNMSPSDRVIVAELSVASDWSRDLNAGSRLQRLGKAIAIERGRSQSQPTNSAGELGPPLAPMAKRASEAWIYSDSHLSRLSLCWGAAGQAARLRLLLFFCCSAAHLSFRYSRATVKMRRASSIERISPVWYSRPSISLRWP